MDKVRKIIDRLWFYKERLVFGAMVLVLGWYVYQAVNPSPPPEEVVPEIPITDIGKGRYVPPPWPPPFDPRRPADWSSIYERNPFWYYSTAVEGAKQGRQKDPGIRVLNIRVVGDKNRAQLQTQSSTKWYTEGESFESFELLEVDPEAGTCKVYAEQLGETVELALPRE